MRRFASDRGQVSHRSGQGSESAAGKLLVSRRGDLTSILASLIYRICFSFFGKGKKLKKVFKFWRGNKNLTTVKIFQKSPLKSIFFRFSSNPYPKVINIYLFITTKLNIVLSFVAFICQDLKQINRNIINKKSIKYFMKSKIRDLFILLFAFFFIN